MTTPELRDDPTLLTDGDDVVSLLLEDHARTRALMRRAYLLTRERGPAPGVSDLADQMQRFFRYWNPLHEVDEEQSVAPAVAAYTPAGVGRDVLARVVTEHEGLDALRERVSVHWAALADDARAMPEIRDDLRRATKDLVRTMSRHTAWEERAFFPLVRRYVPPSVQRALLAVMRGRRALPPAAGPGRATTRP